MKRLLQDYGVLVALVALLILNIVTRGESFLQVENLRNLLSQNAYVGIIAIGMTFVIMTAGIDLSVGSMVALCGTVGVLVLNKQSGDGATDGAAIFAAFAATVATGLVAGAGALVIVVSEVGGGAARAGATTFCSSPPHAASTHASAHAADTTHGRRMIMTGLLSFQARHEHVAYQAPTEDRVHAQRAWRAPAETSGA